MKNFSWTYCIRRLHHKVTIIRLKAKFSLCEIQVDSNIFKIGILWFLRISFYELFDLIFASHCKTPISASKHFGPKLVKNWSKIGPRYIFFELRPLRNYCSWTELTVFYQILHNKRNLTVQVWVWGQWQTMDERILVFVQLRKLWSVQLYSGHDVKWLYCELQYYSKSNEKTPLFFFFWPKLNAGSVTVKCHSALSQSLWLIVKVNGLFVNRIVTMPQDNSNYYSNDVN